MSTTPPTQLPQATITHYGHGELPKSWLPGDVGVVRNRRQDATDSLIRCRERWTCGRTAAADLDHMFCVVGSGGSIVEAEMAGIQLNDGANYKDADFWLVSFVGPSQAQRNLSVAFWMRQVGTPYDLVDFILTQAPMALFDANFSLHSDRGWICSGLGCTGLLKQVVEFDLPAESMTPGDFINNCGLDLGVEPLPLSLTDHLLDALCWPGRMLHKSFSALARAIGSLV